MNPEDKIGKYTLEELIGEGGMGQVWLSHDPDLGIPVAIKTLFPHLRESDPIFVQRFVQEATHAARLNHPNIARIYAAGCEDNTNFIVMEHLSGGTADDLIGNPPDLETLARIRKMVVESTDGLTAAHRAGIVHRDVKPANILFDEHGTAKLADLGIGKGLSSGAENQSLTMTGHVVGTPYYMAPEQATGAKFVDTRSDIYALGATWYHLATGTVPFDGETSVGIMLRHVQDDRPDARELNPAVTETDAAIIQKMMACEPGDRFQTPQELLDALRGDFAAPSSGTSKLPWIIGAVIGVVAALIFVLLTAKDAPPPPDITTPDAPPVETAAVTPEALPAVEIIAGPSIEEPEPPAVAPVLATLPALPTPDLSDPIYTALDGMVVIHPGDFTMGSDDPIDSTHGEPASPAHRVRIPAPFQMAKSTVTKTEFARFCHAADYRTSAERAGRAQHYGASGWQEIEDATWRTASSAHNHPVVDVSWDDATAYCAWLTDRDRRTNKITADYAYRLPTEAEWEYACRAGTSTAFSFGAEASRFADFANCRDQSSGLPPGNLWFEKTAAANDGQTQHAPVASYTANPWGLFDMHGNVWEWCLDSPRVYEAETAVTPIGPTTTRRVFRGGSWDAAPNLSRSAFRFAMSARRAANNLGFRIVLAKTND